MRRLTVDNKIGYTVALVALVASFITLFIPIEYVLYVAAPLFLVLAVAASTFIAKRSIHSYFKRQVTVIVAAVVAVYLMLHYLLGIEFGFVIAAKDYLFINSIFRKILPLAVIVSASEIVRSVLLAEKQRAVTVISYFIGVASVLICAGGIPSFRSSFQLVDFMGTALFPALTANITFTYLSGRYGMLPNLIYRLALTLYVYIIPITPDVPKIITAFVLMILPLAMQLFIDMLFEKKVRRAKARQGKWRFVFPAVLGVFMVGVILLISCKFRYGILVIATESMSGEIEKGDAVVFESYEHCEEVEENDVIVFLENNRQVVHRVVEIQTVDGVRQYITKGDANEGVDSGFRTDGDIIGVVRFKMVYVGYPSLWLKDIFER